MVYSMRAGTLRLGILAYLAFIFYLLQANGLRQTGVANLPLTFETNTLESFGIQITVVGHVIARSPHHGPSQEASKT